MSGKTNFIAFSKFLIRFRSGHSIQITFCRYFQGALHFHDFLALIIEIESKVHCFGSANHKNQDSESDAVQSKVNNTRIQSFANKFCLLSTIILCVPKLM